MRDGEQSVGGGRAHRVRRKDGPNWFLIAGGAIVMAVSVAFGRRKILRQEELSKEKVSIANARTQVVPHKDGETGSVPTSATVLNGMPCWVDKSIASSQLEFECRSLKSKFSRQLSQSSDCQCNEEPVQFDSHTTAALQASLTDKREMVFRLRQQIRSRDATIFDMQSQLSDLDQLIALRCNHSVDLRECVAKVSKAKLEVKRLHRQLNFQPIKLIAELDEESVDIVLAEIKRQRLVLEARKSLEPMECLKRENEAKANLAQAKSRQCDMLSKNVSNLAKELEEVKIAAQEKQRLLEEKEQENLKLTNVLQELQQKVEIEYRGHEWARSSRLSRRTNTQNKQPSWNRNYNVDHVTPTNYEELRSTCKPIVNY